MAKTAPSLASFLLFLFVSSHVNAFQPTRSQKAIQIATPVSEVRPVVGCRRLSAHPDPSSISREKQRWVVLQAAFASLASVSVAANIGLVPGPQGEIYTNSLVLRDIGTSLLCIIFSSLFVKSISVLAGKGLLEPRDSRKIIHTLSAPLFMLLWPLFTPAGRWFAACVPFTFAVRLFLASSTDNTGESELAYAVSRSGDKKEALGGPFVYVIMLFTAIILFWRDSLAGIVALCTMAVGDGLADILGRRFGKSNKWFFSEKKSVAGSLAFWVGAALASIALSIWMWNTGSLSLPIPMSLLVPRLVLITGICACVELIPLGDDNLTVPLAAAGLSVLLL